MQGSDEGVITVIRSFFLRLTMSLAGVLASVLSIPSTSAGDWASWRGPTGMGHTKEKGLPILWGGRDGKNVLWKVALLPDQDGLKLDNNQSSPIVSRDHVFATVSYWPKVTTQKEYPQHHVLCFRNSDGKRVWDTQIKPGPWRLTDLRGGYTAPTPASDGQRIYVVFGSSVIAALNFDGKVLWRKEIVPYKTFDVAFGTSPIIYKDSVLLMCDAVSGASRLLAFDGKTGELKWERKRPEVGFAHSTPVLVNLMGKDQLLVSASNRVQGLDPADGNVLWWCRAQGDTASPVYGGGLVFCDSGRGGAGIAVDPIGQGDISKTHLKWKVANIPQGFSSPLIVGDHLYRLHDPGVLTCWKLASGKPVYSERLTGVQSAASPFVTSEGRIYCAGAGRSYVIAAGPAFKVLATNNLDDDSQASPAVSDGRIFLKGRRFLFCIGAK
jgi:outer membrane protein assembly factor BamB